VLLSQGQTAPHYNAVQHAAIHRDTLHCAAMHIGEACKVAEYPQQYSKQ